jgi:hypothetical protein
MRLSVHKFAENFVSSGSIDELLAVGADNIVEEATKGLNSVAMQLGLFVEKRSSALGGSFCFWLSHTI